MVVVDSKSRSPFHGLDRTTPRGCEVKVLVAVATCVLCARENMAGVRAATKRDMTTAKHAFRNVATDEREANRDETA